MAPNLYGNTMQMSEPCIEDDKQNHDADKLNNKSEIVNRNVSSCSKVSKDSSDNITIASNKLFL